MKTRIAVALCALAFLLPTEGCSPTTTQIQNDGQALYNTLAQVAAVEQPLNPSLSANLLLAAKGLLAVTSVWQTGSPVADFNDAATAVEVALAAIPQTAAVAPFVPIIVGGIDAIIANIPGAKATTVSTVYSAQANGLNLAAYRLEAVSVVKHKAFRSPEGDFKAAWNGEVTSHPVPGIFPIH